MCVLGTSSHSMYNVLSRSQTHCKPIRAPNLLQMYLGPKPNDISCKSLGKRYQTDSLGSVWSPLASQVGRPCRSARMSSHDITAKMMATPCAAGGTCTFSLSVPLPLPMADPSRCGPPSRREAHFISQLTRQGLCWRFWRSTSGTGACATPTFEVVLLAIARVLPQKKAAQRGTKVKGHEAHERWPPLALIVALPVRRVKGGRPEA